MTTVDELKKGKTLTVLWKISTKSDVFLQDKLDDIHVYNCIIVREVNVVSNYSQRNIVNILPGHSEGIND